VNVKVRILIEKLSGGILVLRVRGDEEGVINQLF